MRVENNGTRYFSFQELPGVAKTKKTKGNDQQREKFGNIHRCKICKTPMTWIAGTNVCVCQNPKCKGMKSKRAEDGAEQFSLSFHTLRDKDVEMANSLFGEVV